MRYHRLPEPSGTFEWPSGDSDWTLRRLLAEDAVVRGWVSFDALAFDAATGAGGSVWCGLNVLDPVRFGILQRFDLRTGAFERIDLGDAVDRFDLKIHKGIAMDDGCLIFGTASFVEAPDQGAAAGGKIIVYDTRRRRVAACHVAVGPAAGFPLGGQYVQSTVYNPAERVVYGCTYPLEVFFACELSTGRSRFLAHLQGTQLGQPHNFVRDADGRVWGTYGLRNGWSYVPNRYPVRPFFYDPAVAEFTWLESCLLPRESPAGDPGNDALAIDGEWLYVADKAANLNRVHLHTYTVETVGRLSPRGRLACLTAAEGALWAVAGDGGEVELLRIDGRSVQRAGAVRADDGERPERIHDLVYSGGGRFFAGENDHHGRSSYLWELQL